MILKKIRGLFYISYQYLFASFDILGALESRFKAQYIKWGGVRLLQDIYSPDLLIKIKSMKTKFEV